MIKKSVFEQDLILGMQRELQAHDYKQAMSNLPQAGNYLQAAMEILEEMGLSAQANQVLEILSKLADDRYKPGDFIEMKSVLHEPRHHDKKHEHKKDKELTFKSLEDKNDAKSPRPKDPRHISDPHVKGLTPEKMVENYKHHGIPFNMADDGKADDLLNIDINDALEVSESGSEEKGFEDES